MLKIVVDKSSRCKLSLNESLDGPTKLCLYPVSARGALLKIENEDGGLVAWDSGVATAIAIRLNECRPYSFMIGSRSAWARRVRTFGGILLFYWQNLKFRVPRIRLFEFYRLLLY